MSKREDRVVETYIRYNGGESIERIASELGVGTQTIKTYIREIDSNQNYYAAEVVRREKNFEFWGKVILIVVVSSIIFLFYVLLTQGVFAALFILFIMIIVFGSVRT